MFLFRVILVHLLLFFLVNVNGQVFVVAKIVDTLGLPVSNASVLIKNDKKQTIGFGYSLQDGTLKLLLQSSKILDTINVVVRCINYAEKLVTTPILPNSVLRITLTPSIASLPTITVRNLPIFQNKDTLNYDVKSFAQKQDMVIGDIIKRLPGIEVSDNGQIKYNGKPINKYYIEGNDLLDDKYNVANNNLPASAVDKVQVLENHQPIKLLNSVINSNQAALNLKLNNAAKNKLLGKAKLGAGLPFPLWDVELTPMMFAKNKQSIYLYKYNNCGIDYANDLNQFNSSNSLNLVKGKMLASPFTNGILVYLSNISKGRFNFNDLHTFSINQLYKTKNKQDLKVNVDYINDQQAFIQSNSYKYLFADNTVNIIESQRLTKYTETLKGNISYIENSKKTYVKNQLLFSKNNTKEVGTMMAVDTIPQINKNAVNFIANDFQLLKTTTNKDIFGFSNFISFSDQNNSLTILKNNYPFLNNFGAKTTDLFQNCYQRTFYTNSNFTFIKKTKFINISNELGFYYSNQKLKTALNKQFNNINFLIADSLINSIKSNELVLYNNLTISYNRPKLKINVSLPFQFFNQHSSAIQSNISELISNFSVGAIFTVNNFFKVNVDLASNKSYQPTFQTVENNILKNYRTLSNYGNFYKFTSTKSVDISLNYKNVYEYIFANAGVSYNNNPSNFIVNQNYTATFLLSRYIVFDNENSSLTYFATASKYFSKAKSTLKISASYNSDKHNLLANEILNKSVNNTLQISSNISSKIKDYGINYTIKYSTFNSKIVASTQKNQTATLLNTLTIDKVFANNVIAKLAIETTSLYPQNDNTNKHFYFADIALRKKMFNNKVDAEVGVQNLFNLQNLEYQNISLNFIAISNFQILPRQLFIKTTFNF